MNARHIYTVFCKELVDMLRDRRTLISMIAVPVVVMPLLILGMGALTASTVSKARKETPRVMVLGATNAPGLVAALRELESLAIVPPSLDYTNQISEKKIRAAVEIPEGFERALETGRSVAVKIYVYEGEIKSGFAAQTLDRFFRDYRDEAVGRRLAERDLPETFIKPFEIQRRNVAPPQKVTGNILGGLLPYMVILLCMIGGMYPAMDLTAGEKERGTMETLLCSPIHRINLVLGKFLMVLTAALTTAVLSILSIAATFQIGKSALGGSTGSQAGALALTVDPWSVVGVFVMVIPVAFLLSAAQLAISLFARSFKEAQTYVTPLIFMTIIPSMVSLAPGIELNLKLALIPILNVSLVCKEIMTGTWSWPYITLIFGSTAIYAGLALVVAVKLFQREEVIMRT